MMAVEQTAIDAPPTLLTLVWFATLGKVTHQNSELLLPGLPEPDLSELERWHDPAFRDRLVDILTSIAGLADAKDPDATALLNAVNPLSRREH